MLKILTSWDDGRYQDVYLAQLLKKYDIPAIFFIPSNCQLNEREIKEIAKDFELGGHTVSHPENLRLMDPDLAYLEISLNKELLESIVDYKLRWFCYPGGKYGEATKEIVKELGFEYARNVNIAAPIKISKGNYDITTSCHVSSERRDYGELDWLDYIKWYIQYYKHSNGVLHIWGHSWEVEKNEEWGKLEELFNYIKELNLEKYECLHSARQ